MQKCLIDVDSLVRDRVDGNLTLRQIAAKYGISKSTAQRLVPDGMTRLNDTDVKDIVADRQRGMKLKDIADFYEVSLATVAGILNGRTHSKVTGIVKPESSKPGRRPSLPKLERKAYRAPTHTRKVVFEFTDPAGLQRSLRDRVSDQTTDAQLLEMARRLKDPKEVCKVYVRYENGTLLRTLDVHD